MMRNYNQSVKINDNPNWLYIPDYSYRILIIGGSGLDKTNMLLILMKHQQPDIDKTYSYVKDPFESKYRLLIYERENVGIKEKSPKAFIDYSRTIDDIYKNLEDHNPTNEWKILTVFGDTITDIEANKKLSPTVAELFLTGIKLNISFVFISQFYFKVPRTIRLTLHIILLWKYLTKENFNK